MPAPIIVKSIPAQVVNEQAAYGPFNLKDFIQSPAGSSPPRFQAELGGGQPLPRGLICTTDGIITGIPAKGTAGNYEIILTAENEAGSIQARFVLTIKPSLITSAAEYADRSKAEVWEALEKNLPIPDLSELYGRPITTADIYYLLERWASLTIWDAFNLDAAGEKHLLHLEGASPHYNVYDRGSCLVTTPKDLFSQERTLVDALQTARAMAREVYKRGWVIEFAGFEKMIRAAWVELQLIGDKYDKHLEILHFDPTFKEMRIYRDTRGTMSSFKLENL